MQGLATLARFDFIRAQGKDITGYILDGLVSSYKYI